MRKPSLSALRAFEAAARLGSVRKAAQELAIDHAVVSRHVKDLQAELSADLLQREGNRLVLTDIGADLSKRLTSAFGEIDEAVITARRNGEGPILRVECIHGFAQRWLLPRLDGFNARYPDVNVQLFTVDEGNSSSTEASDLVICYGDCPSADTEHRFLAQPSFYPVVSRLIYDQMLSIYGAPSKAWFENIAWLHETDGTQWAHWGNLAFGTVLARPKDTTFSNATIAIEAALLGKGAALVNDYLVGDYIRSGQLVRIFEQPIALGAYYLVVRAPGTYEQWKGRFADWLTEQIADAEATIIGP